MQEHGAILRKPSQVLVAVTNRCDVVKSFYACGVLLPVCCSFCFTRGWLCLCSWHATPAFLLCCRRNGKHHCETRPQGEGFRTSSSNCPYRGSTALISHSAPLSTVTTALIVSLGCEKSVAPESPSLSLPDGGNVSKRGPPLS